MKQNRKWYKVFKSSPVSRIGYMAPGWDCDADWAWAVCAECETGEGQRDIRGWSLVQRSPPPADHTWVEGGDQWPRAHVDISNINIQ